VKLFDAESGAEVLHSRSGVVIFAGQAEEPKKAPRKTAPKKAVKAPEKAEEKAEAPAKIPGKAPANFIDLARTGNTKAARAYWSRRVAQYEG
jgi:hypothetical protein